MVTIMTTGHSLVKRVNLHIEMPTETSKSEGRYQPADVRRRQILDAATKLALEEGLGDTSIARVAEVAGVAKGSIYLHFRSRDELLAGLQADIWNQMLEHPAEVADSNELSWAQKLDAVAEHWMRFELDNHGLYHAVFHEIPSNAEEPMAGARDLLGRIVEGGVEAGEFDLKELDLDVLIHFLLHGYIGPCFHHSDQEKAISDVKELFRRLVGASS